MSKVYQTPVVSLPCNAVAIHEGYLYKAASSTYYMTPTTAKDDTVVAVAMTSSEDAQLGTAKTLSAGDEWMFALLGSGKIVNVAFITGLTVLPGDPVYASATSAHATNAADTSRPIGHAIVKTSTTTTAGMLLPVVLDYSIGTATV